MTYHASPQVRGRLNHTTVDTGTYASEKQYLQGEEVYSEQYGLVGKIDLYDNEHMDCGPAFTVFGGLRWGIGGHATTVNAI